MDLVSVERLYKNRTIIAITICIIVLLTVAIFIGNQILNSQKKEEVYHIYFKQYLVGQKIKTQEIIKDVELQAKNAEIKKKKQEIERLPNLTEEGIANMASIYKSETKRVFLTFDDGPSKTVTPLILDLLKKEDIQATFFVLGARVELNPDLVKREYVEGHYIANHGYSHIYSKIYTSPQTVLDEYNKTNTAVQNAIGQQNYNSHLFRFPGGKPGGKYAEIKAGAVDLLKENNIAYVDWNALTGDAEGKTTPEEMLTELKETAKDRNSLVILMHDAGDKKATYQVLPSVIQYLRDEGYEFKNFYDIIK